MSYLKVNKQANGKTKLFKGCDLIYYESTGCKFN